MTLYAATELAELISSAGNAVEGTTASTFSSTYGIRTATRPGTGSTDYITAGTGLGSFTTFWDRFTFYAASAITSGRTLRQYHNSSGTAVFRIQATSADTLQAQYWNGSAWTNIGTTFSTAITSTLRVFDIKIICGGSGSFEWYVGGSLYTSGSASMTSVTNIDEWRGYSTNAGTGEAYFSENIWGDESTIGHRYCIAPPTGDGTYTAGSGAFGDVDEAITNDADFSTLSANGDAETYTHGAMTLPSGTVKAVQVSARVKNAATGAQNVKARLRLSSTNYDQASNYAGIGAGFTAYRARWGVDPSTSATWTQAAAKATGNEFGLLAQT